eukprot:SAG25_NODE_7555_length_473_cov_0.933155_2_plen_49_part_01
MIVRTESRTIRCAADIFFVTDMPKKLKKAIEKIMHTIATIMVGLLGAGM